MVDLKILNILGGVQSQTNPSTSRKSGPFTGKTGFNDLFQELILPNKTTQSRAIQLGEKGPNLSRRKQVGNLLKEKLYHNEKPALKTGDNWQKPVSEHGNSRKNDAANKSTSVRKEEPQFVTSTKDDPRCSNKPVEANQDAAVPTDEAGKSKSTLPYNQTDKQISEVLLTEVPVQSIEDLGNIASDFQAETKAETETGYSMQADNGFSEPIMIGPVVTTSLSNPGDPDAASPFTGSGYSEQEALLQDGIVSSPAIGSKVEELKKQVPITDFNDDAGAVLAKGSNNEGQIEKTVTTTGLKADAATTLPNTIVKGDVTTVEPAQLSLIAGLRTARNDQADGGTTGIGDKNQKTLEPTVPNAIQGKEGMASGPQTSTTSEHRSGNFNNSQGHSNAIAGLGEHGSKNSQNETGFRSIVNQAVDSRAPLGNEPTGPARMFGSKELFSGNRQEVIRQIVEQVELIRKPGANELSVQLKPEFLGKVNLRLTIEDGLVSAKFIAENPQVKQMLESNLAQLKQSLEEQGLKFNRLEVGVGGQGTNPDRDGSQLGFLFSQDRETREQNGLTNRSRTHQLTYEPEDETLNRFEGHRTLYYRMDSTVEFLA